MNKKDVNIFFPELEKEYVEIWQQVAEPNKDLPNLSEEIERLQDSLYPVDPVTGNRSNDVSKLLSSTVSPMEKEKILANMQKMPTSKRSNLSDDELISMLPSRRNLTLVDADGVREYYEKEIFPNLEATEQSVEQGTEQGAEQSAVE